MLDGHTGHVDGGRRCCSVSVLCSSVPAQVGPVLCSTVPALTAAILISEHSSPTFKEEEPTTELIENALPMVDAGKDATIQQQPQHDLLAITP